MAGRSSVAAALGFVAAAVVAGGCLDAQAPLDTESMPHDHHGMHALAGAFTMDAASCEEGGFVAVYGMRTGEKQTGGWELEDIRDEVGKPMRDGLGSPLVTPAKGNWHMGFRCASATVNGETEKNYIFGWVGNMIKAPSFDPGGADVHFVVSGLGVGNGTFGDALRATTKAGISHSYEPTKVTWHVPKEAPRSAVTAVYSDTEKGIYISHSEMSKYRDFPARTVRLWWQVPADGSQGHADHDHGTTTQPEAGMKWHPTYWDVKTTGGEQYTTPPLDSAEIGCHMGTADHGPTGGACQPTLTDVYEHKSLVFTSGTVIEDVTLDSIWVH